MSKSSPCDYWARQYYSGLKQLGRPFAEDKLNQKKLTDIQTEVYLHLIKTTKATTCDLLMINFS